MQSAQQFTAFLENKPGRLSNICAALAKEKVNIQAMTVMDSSEHSVLRIVVDKASETQEILKRLGTPFSETAVTVVDLKNQPGAIARVCDRLAAEHVNIDYMYCSAGNKNGKTTVVLKASPMERVKSVLDNNVAPKPTRLPQRRPPVRK